MLKWF